MVSTNKLPDDAPRKKPPATTPEARENELIGLALDEAERQIKGGTASSQILVHFLKLASSRDRLEREKIRLENMYTAKKIDNIDAQVHAEELYENAINAMRSYNGGRSGL